MQLKPFHLDEWLEQHEHTARYNLAASTGPSWTVDELIRLMSDEEKERFFHSPLTYCPGNGHESLRHELRHVLLLRTRPAVALRARPCVRLGAGRPRPPGRCAPKPATTPTWAGLWAG